MKFDFSKSKDLQNKSQLNKLDLIMKNVLHITYQIDSLRQQITSVEAVLKKVLNSSELQKQVDDYFDENSNVVHPEDARDLD